MDILKRSDKKRFVSLATLRHNANIETIQYSNPKVVKTLFVMGAVLPDLKLSWGALLVYVTIKEPIKLKRLHNALREIKHKLHLLVLKRGYM